MRQNQSNISHVYAGNPLDRGDRERRDEQLMALLATCDRGQEPEDRRDAAIIRVFIDTGARLS